jgi:hypothetical protein
MSATSNPDLQSAIDARLADAIAMKNFRLTLVNQKANAKLKLQHDLTYSINGGIFKISTELVSFISALLAMEKDQAILIDIHGNPVEVLNLQEFMDSIVNQYYESTNAFLVEFNRIQKSRTPKALIGVV